MLTAASEQTAESALVAASVSGPSALSVKQREFALAYVLNGGKGGDAAVAAGYSADSAHVAASRCLVNPKVGAEIARLSRSLIHTALPQLIAELVSIATDKTIAPRDRLKALNSLLERGGIATDKAGVQVNVGVAVNGQQAQALISEVWSARTGRLSDIPPAMPDTELRQIEQSIELIASPAGDLAGGGGFQGPVAGTCPVPVSPSANAPKPSVSCECPLCRDKPAPGTNGFEGFDRSQGEGDE